MVHRRFGGWCCRGDSVRAQVGKETRESIAGAASRGREFADRKRGDVAEFSRSVVDQGREFASAAKDAIDKGRERLSDLSPSRPKETPEAS